MMCFYIFFSPHNFGYVLLEVRLLIFPRIASLLLIDREKPLPREKGIFSKTGAKELEFP